MISVGLKMPVAGSFDEIVRQLVGEKTYYHRSGEGRQNCGKSEAKLRQNRGKTLILVAGVS
jgi:hypothetical protein